MGPESFCFGLREKWVQPNKIDSSKRLQLVKTRYGFQMYVDSKDGSVSMKIRKYGTWEPYIAAVIARLVKPGDHVLNLGSQSGMESMIMGMIVGSKGHLSIF